MAHEVIKYLPKTIKLAHYFLLRNLSWTSKIFSNIIADINLTETILFDYTFCNENCFCFYFYYLIYPIIARIEAIALAKALKRRHFKLNFRLQFMIGRQA